MIGGFLAVVVQHAVFCTSAEKLMSSLKNGISKNKFLGSFDKVFR